MAYFNEGNTVEQMLINAAAQREIKKKLHSILWIKYSIKDTDVFEKAYQ